MKSIAAYTAAFLFVIGSVASAQEQPSRTPEPPPEPPLIAKAAVNSQWIITYTLKTPEKDPVEPGDVRARKLRVRYSPLVLTRRVLKGPEQTVVYTSYEAGLKSEAWVVGGFLYQLPMREGEGINVEPRTQGDFSELYWVSAANFRGTVAYKGRKVHLYESEAGDPDPASGKASGPHDEDTGNSGKGVPRRAYVDVKTRLPVAVEAGGDSWSYRFSDAPSPFPTMDERIAQQINSSKK